ncbi:MAG: tetratricopeptide repeat protein, partial [Phycisphaerae bacterium]
VLLEEPTPVRRLNVHVPRALAAIIQRAMEKNPERRHPSAAVLAEDLRRFLAGEPLLTQAPGAGARLARLVRRHTVAFAFVSAVFLLVIGFGAWMAVLYARADELARIAQAQERAAVAAQEAEGAARLRAESEASKAKQVQAFLEEMLASVDPSVAQMRDTTLLRELLDNASARVERELAQQPEAAAAVHTTIGLTFKAMGLLDEASPHLAAALDIRRGALGADHVDSRASLLNWADLVYARGELAEAERLVRDAMAQCRAATGPESVESVAARLKLVEVLGDLGRLDEAERLCRQALEVCRRHGRAMDGNRPAALNNLATLVAQRGAFDEAEDLMREALDVTRERVGDVHRDTLLVMSNLASVLRRAGKLDECERLTRTALETRRKLLGEKHPDTLISTVNFAQLLQQQKRFDEAEPLVRRALMLFRETLGDRHQYTLVTRYNLAGLLKDAGRFDEAIDVAEQAASAYEEVFGPDHADTLDSMLHLARCLADGGRLERARDVLESALQRANAAATIEPALMGRIESQLGATLLGLGEFVRAEPLLLSADRLLTAGLGAEERQTIWNVEWLVELYERQEREDQAQRWRAKLPRSQPPESP